MASSGRTTRPTSRPTKAHQDPSTIALICFPFTAGGDRLEVYRDDGPTRRFATMPPVLLTGRELAQTLGRRYEDVLAWAREGLIPSIRTGRGQVYFDLDRTVRAIRDRSRREAPEPDPMEAVGA